MRLLKTKGIVALVLFIAIGALLLALMSQQSDKSQIEALEKRMNLLKIEAKTRRLPRSVLRGEPVQGKAWDEYQLALDHAVANMGEPAGTLLETFVLGKKGADRAKVEELIARNPEPLDQLRRGAQRTDSQYPYYWEQGMAMERPDSGAIKTLTNLAAAQARMLSEKGRHQEAIDLLLDLVAFSRDLSTNSPRNQTFQGAQSYAVAFDGLRRVIVSGELTQEQLSDLSKMLEVIDREYLPMGPMISNQALMVGVDMLYDDTPDLEDRFEMGNWQFALYPRATLHDALAQADTLMQRVGKLDQMNFADAKKETAAISTAVRSARNPMVSWLMMDTFAAVRAHHVPLANLRLLRSATTYLSSGELPTMADPFGDKVLSKQEPGKLKIWSLGLDGTNQNGTGDFGGKPDMVLELPRK